MNIQKVLVGIVAVVILVLGVTFPRGNPVIQKLVAGGIGGNHTETEQFFGGLVLGQGFGQGVPGAIETGGGSFVTSTTTSMCIVKPPLATSTIEQARLKITLATTTTTVIAFGTSTNPYATTSASSLVTQTNLTGATRPLVYNGGANMFQLPTEYGIFYYTSLTTNGQLAQQQAGSCSELFGQF